ncbi:hypothetical protein ACFL5G_03345 [Candidatus Margulisiibacteriota bacterium]
MLKLIRKYKTTVLILFILGALFRLGYNSYLGWDRPLIGDEQRYYKLAKSLAENHNYLDNGQPSTQMPGTSLILAFFFTFFGASPIIGKIIISLSSALIAPLTFLFAQKFQGKYLPAVLSGFWMAVYPYFLHQSTMMDSENFFIPLFIFFLFYLLDLKVKNISIKLVIWGGLLWGALALIRPNAFYLTFFLLIWLFCFQDKLLQYAKEKLKISAIFLAGFILVLAPWTIRNYVHFSKFIPTNTDAMEILLASHNERTFTDPIVAGNYLGLYDVIGSKKYDAMSDTARKDYLIRTFKKHWYRFPWLAIQKLKWFWHFSPKHPYHRNLRDDLVGLFSYGIFIPFMIWGFWSNRRNKKYQFLLWLIFYFSLMTVATYGCTRLRLPLDPFLIMVAFIEIVRLLPKNIQKRFN